MVADIGLTAASQVGFKSFVDSSERFGSGDNYRDDTIGRQNLHGVSEELLESEAVIVAS